MNEVRSTSKALKQSKKLLSQLNPIADNRTSIDNRDDDDDGDEREQSSNESNRIDVPAVVNNDAIESNNIKKSNSIFTSQPLSSSSFLSISKDVISTYIRLNYSTAPSKENSIRDVFKSGRITTDLNQNFISN